MINLRPVNLNDITYFQVWWRDKDLVKVTSGDLEYLSDEQIEEYFKNIIKSHDDIHRMISIDSGQVIGHASLIKRQDGWYEAQIVIGDKASHNKGYGTESIRQIIALAKSQNINNVYLEVRPNNIRAIRAYQRAGFHIVGEFTTDNSLQPSLVRMEL